MTAAAAAKSLQSCSTLCDPIDVSPPGSPVPGILQARTLEWVVISFSNAWKWKSESEVAQLCLTLATPWTAAYQAPLSMGFSRQKCWSGVPLPSWIQYKASQKHIFINHSVIYILEWWSWYSLPCKNLIFNLWFGRGKEMFPEFRL